MGLSPTMADSKVVWNLALQWYGTQSYIDMESDSKVVWNLALQWYGTQSNIDIESDSKVIWNLALQWYGTQSYIDMESDSKVVWNLALQWYGTQFYSSMGSDSLNSRSFARAWRTREAPMRLERAADSVAANTPTVMRGGTTLMSYRGEEEGGRVYSCAFFVSVKGRL